MTMIQYLSAFRVYDVDVLFLAMGVTLCTSLLKKTVMKNCSRKLFVFLPFALGLAFFATFRAIVTLSAIPFTTGFAETLEGGFACGCAATLYYVVYEQFFKTSTATEPVSVLLEGFVPRELVAEAAKELTEGGKNLSAEELLPFVTETLRRYCAPEESGAEAEAEIALLAKTVTEFLIRLPK